MSVQTKKNGLRLKIIEKSIELFNEQGYTSVTVRDIANQLKISPGNFTYYFKKKKDLTKAIFDLQYVDYQKMNLNPHVDIAGLQQIFQAIISHQQKYFFYFNSIIEIPRRYPEFSDVQKKVIDDFHQLFSDILKNYEKKGIMKAELNTGAYDDLAFALLSIILFWMEGKSLKGKTKNTSIIKVLWNILLPTFTSKGMDMFQTLKIL